MTALFVTLCVVFIIIAVSCVVEVKKKGEAPKCKTCKRFYDCTKSHGTMTMACDRYERKKKRK